MDWFEQAHKGDSPLPHLCPTHVIVLPHDTKQPFETNESLSSGLEQALTLVPAATA